jgi:hypothetical protein
MKIYMPSSPDNYELCHPVRQEDFELINVLINGTSRLEAWNPIPMQIIHEDKGTRFFESDSPWLGGHALIFKPQAVKAIGSLLQEFGELLPLLCNDADVMMYNPTHLLDALDEDASSVLRFTGGRIMWINKYVFRPEIIGHSDIFKIPNLRVSPTFVSQRFVDLWNSADLKGLEFKLVWAPN